MISTKVSIAMARDRRERIRKLTNWRTRHEFPTSAPRSHEPLMWTDVQCKTHLGSYSTRPSFLVQKAKESSSCGRIDQLRCDSGTQWNGVITWSHLHRFRFSSFTFAHIQMKSKAASFHWSVQWPIAVSNAALNTGNSLATGIKFKFTRLGWGTVYQSRVTIAYHAPVSPTVWTPYIFECDESWPYLCDAESAPNFPSCRMDMYFLFDSLDFLGAVPQWYRYGWKARPIKLVFNGLGVKTYNISMQYIKMFVAKRHVGSCWWLPPIRDLGQYIAQSVTSPIYIFSILFSLDFEHRRHQRHRTSPRSVPTQTKSWSFWILSRQHDLFQLHPPPPPAGSMQNFAPALRSVSSLAPSQRRETGNPAMSSGARDCEHLQPSPLFILGEPGADRGAGGKLGRAETPSAVIFRSPQFPARPTICPWISEDAFIWLTGILNTVSWLTLQLKSVFVLTKKVLISRLPTTRYHSHPLKASLRARSRPTRGPFC